MLGRGELRLVELVGRCGRFWTVFVEIGELLVDSGGLVKVKLWVILGEERLKLTLRVGPPHAFLHLVFVLHVVPDVQELVMAQLLLVFHELGVLLEEVRLPMRWLPTLCSACRNCSICFVDRTDFALLVSLFLLYLTAYYLVHSWLLL